MARGSKFRVQIEIVQKNQSLIAKDLLKNPVKGFLKSNNVIASVPRHFNSSEYASEETLRDHVEFFDVIPEQSKYPVR